MANPTKSSTLKEFREFAFKGNVIDLAVGVVIGAAFQKIISAIVDGLIMPVVSLLLPSGQWREYVVRVWKAEIKVGSLLGNTLDFVIVAFVLFLIVKRFLHHQKKHDPTPPALAPAEESRDCPACLEKIPKKARRCKHCTEIVEPEISPAAALPRAPA
ncbi:MAG TPA: large conductance mechanosensitive channel protein MscL [Polyangiaceae bacterium]|jgi:large conductance mechanosensitive channel|nr:large conductance mechanosensitive channel protein MscL [Polyangiaceae bacterium]